MSAERQAEPARVKTPRRPQRSRWMLRIMGALLLALLIWFAGPLVAFADMHPLDPEWARIALIAALLVFMLGRLLLKQMKAQLGNRQLFDLLASRTDHKKETSAPPEVQARFEKAAALLKTMRLGGAPGSRSRSGFLGLFEGRRYAYQLPWYLFIGAPGSGKTTALTRSGLHFPLADALGNDPLQGIGGTRNCEWWFTDRAVLIDTAGRYTTQDSNAKADAAEWKEFIDLIRRFRPRQPINGVLATISAADLLGGQSGQAELSRQAAALRARIAELQRHVGHAFPVYLLVTKTDLLPGFTQFFEDLDREQREQVWGCTFKMPDRSRGVDLQQQLRPQLDALEDRLFAQLLPRLQASRDGATRTLTYGFPNQWVQLKETLADFTQQAFSASSLTGPSWLRGVYFTSGTQEGTPIDRVLGSLSRSFGIERKLLPPQRPTGKSFFITRLLNDVVFAEAPLAGTNHAAEARMQKLKWGGMLAGGLASVAAIGLWTASFLGNDAYIDDVAAKAAAFSKTLAARPPRPDDVPDILAMLDAVRKLAHTQRVDPDAPALHLRGGLFQGEKLEAGADQAYGRMLSAYLAPLASARIESGLRQKAVNAELQYETLKAYLMLHRQGRLDPDALKAWLAFDMENDGMRDGTRRFPAEIREHLLQHMDALLRRDSLGPGIAPDAGLISRVRQEQLQAPFAQRVYSRIKRQGMAAPGASSAVKEFRIADAGGPNSQIVFARRSGQPLSTGVPALFTYEGYYKGFNPQVDDMVKSLGEEEVWILGVAGSDNARRAANLATRTSLDDEVRRLYLQDYAGIWETFIADIGLVSAANLGQSIEQARLLSGADSPLPRLLRALVREVTLSERPDLASLPADKANALIAQGKDKLDALLGARSPQASGEPRRIEAIVDDRFEQLRRFVRNPAPGQPAPMEASLKLINDLYALLSATDAALKSGNTQPQSDVPQRMKAEAARMPEPVRGMLAALADGSQRQAVAGSRGNLSMRMASLVGEPCSKALDGRYPFVPGSSRDAVPEDFVRILARDGVMDDFFQKNLQPLVDTTVKPWRFRALGQASDGGGTGTSDALQQFERAHEIRQAFFPPGSNGLTMRLSLRPVGMDASLSQAILDVDGQLVSYAHDNAPAASVQWPGPRMSNRITLQVYTAQGGEHAQTFDGPWALFRLFDKAQIAQSAQPERFRATLNAGGRRVAYDVITSSVQNPFRMPALQAFKCPTKL
jgi:type VI secretion system protein ImpL